MGEVSVIKRNRRSFADLECANRKRICFIEVESVQRFCRIRLEKVTDETTILNFRPLLVYHELGKNLFKTIKEHLAGDSLLLKTGTILR